MWIEIGDPVLTGTRVENKLTVSGELRKYLRYKTLYVEYDEEIRPNPSILNIPAVASLVTFAWLVGAELRVNDLDREFALSMNKLFREYEAMYPGVFDGRLWVRRAWKNKPNPRGLAMFFSGGLDSTYSLYEILERDPRLIMIKGFDYYMDRPGDEKIWQRWKDEYESFAEKKGLKLNFIETNSRACLSEDIINNNFKRSLKLSFWDALRHGPLLIGLAAPLSVGRFNELVVSASRTPQSPTSIYPYSSAPNTDEKITWMGVGVRHFGMVHRYEKVNALAEPLRAGEITLRSCYKRLLTGFNCSVCEKCARVLCFILGIGIDPNTCGFDFNDMTLKLIQRELEQNPRWWYRSKLHWKPWADSFSGEIPEGLREFVSWIKEAEFGVPDLLEDDEL